MEHNLMPALFLPNAYYTPMFLEGFLCGVYSGIFVLYLQCHAFTEATSNAKKIIFWALCVLYVLSVVVFVLDFVAFVSFQLRLRYYIDIIQPVIFGCCDFIAQSILIYRCWIVWARNIHVVIIPLILALAYLAMWMAADSATFIVDGRIKTFLWAVHLNVISIAISMGVNALVTGLIVCRIFMVSQGFQGSTSAEKSLGVIGGRKLNSLIFIIIESGMALFSVQLARVVLSNLPVVNPPINNALVFIQVIHQMLNGITPTIILVRVSMGLSLDDENSSEETSLHFASDGPTLNSFSEMGSISHQEWRDNDPDGSQNIQAMGSNSTIQNNQIT